MCLHRLPHLVVLIGALCASSAAQSGDVLYTVSSSDDQLRVVAPLSGTTLSSTRLMTTANQVVQQCNGMARHPTTGEIWVVFRIAQKGGGRHLGKLNLATAPACALENWPLLPLSFGLVLSGSGPGRGRARIQFKIPLGASADVYWQTASFEGNAFTVSNALHLHAR